MAALETVTKKDLGEAKSLKKPPPGVDDITAVVICLLDNNPKDKSWAAAQKMMNNVDKFLERVKSFKGVIDAGQVRGSMQLHWALIIQVSLHRAVLCCAVLSLVFVALLAPATTRLPQRTPHPAPQVARKTVDACRPYLALEYFNREAIGKKSAAAAGLCEWAVNIIKYYDVVQEVEPKRQELAAANAKLEEANQT
jgi:dynein heavy chain